MRTNWLTVDRGGAECTPCDCGETRRGPPYGQVARRGVKGGNEGGGRGERKGGKGKPCPPPPALASSGPPSPLSGCGGRVPIGGASAGPEASLGPRLEPPMGSRLRPGAGDRHAASRRATPLGGGLRGTAPDPLGPWHWRSSVTPS